MDLVERVQMGLERAGPALDGPERSLLATVLGLDEGALLALARLSGRAAAAFRVPDLHLPGVADPDRAIATLQASSLADGEVTWGVRLAHATRPVLAEGCRRRGLATGGRRQDLADRLADLEGWDDAAWLQLTCGPLLRRAERLATLTVWPDRSAEVLERLHLCRWATYPVRAASLVPDREAWLGWERLVERWEEASVPELFAALDARWSPPGGLDVRDAAAARLFDVAVGEDGDVGVLEGLFDRGWWLGGEVPLRLARRWERAGRAGEALALLRRARDAAPPAVREALEAGGRALGRRARLAWAPLPPLRVAIERHLRWSRDDVVAAGGAAARRPAWRVGEHRGVVETVAVARLGQVGRQAVWGEGAVWRTVAGVLLADLSFLDVQDQLPVPRLSAPLDHGTPAFAGRRAVEVASLRESIRAGQGPALFERAWGRWNGTRLRGVSWEAWPLPLLLALVDAVGPLVLDGFLGVILEEGDRGLAGLPDLVVLPGQVAMLGEAIPARLGPGLVWVEVKGPGDLNRPGQRVWHDRIARWGGRVEVWRVTSVA